MAKETLFTDFSIVLFTLKVLATFVSLALFAIVIGWLRGANNLLLPGLGAVVAAPLLILILAVFEIVLVLIYVLLKALMK